MILTDCYNVKVIEYLHGSEIRIYSDLIGKKELVNDFFSYNPSDDFVDNNNNNDDEFNIYNPSLDVIKEYEQIDVDTYLKDKIVEDEKRVKDSERSLNSSKNRTVNSIYEIARSNEWEYFLTLTFNPEKVDSFNYDDVVKKLSKWINNIKRKYAPDLKYVLVPELHKSGRFHFHGLLSNIGDLKLIDSTKRDKSGNIIYNIGSYKYGWNEVTKVVDTQRVSTYITKYITKELCAVSFGKKRYWHSNNLNKPVVNTYTMSRNEIEDMISSFSDRIIFTKQVDCLYYDLKTTYYQISESR